MKTISQFLQDADPLRHEPTVSSDQIHVRRQAVLRAAANAGNGPMAGQRSRIAVLLVAALLVVGALVLSMHLGFARLSDVDAAVRFEVRLAEDKPGPGLLEAKIAGSGRSVYLGDQIIVSNSDIAAARLIQVGGTPRYNVGVTFNPTGAKKMRAATENQIGRLVAILLDGEVVMAPVIRSPIDSSALITGNFTREQAEKIVNGISPE